MPVHPRACGELNKYVGFHRKTIVKPTALGPVANTDTKLLIYGLFQKGRVLAQDGIDATRGGSARIPGGHEGHGQNVGALHRDLLNSGCLYLTPWRQV